MLGNRLLGLFGRFLQRPSTSSEREFVIDNLLVRIHFIIVMIRWTGLAPWEFEFPFPGSLTSTFLYFFRSTRWTLRVSLGQDFYRNVTKFAPNLPIKLIA